MLWVSSLPTGTVDGTEDRDSGEDDRELEGVAGWMSLSLGVSSMSGSLLRGASNHTVLL